MLSQLQVETTHAWLLVILFWVRMHMHIILQQQQKLQQVQKQHKVQQMTHTAMHTMAMI